MTIAFLHIITRGYGNNFDTFDFKSVLSIQVPCMEFIDPVIFMKGPQFT